MSTPARFSLLHHRVSMSAREDLEWIRQGRLWKMAERVLGIGRSGDWQIGASFARMRNAGVKNDFDRRFEPAARGTTWRRELLAGVTKFMTLASIIAIQPAVLSGRMFDRPTGMEFGARMTATCAAMALATISMALYGRYPTRKRPGWATTSSSF